MRRRRRAVRVTRRRAVLAGTLVLPLVATLTGCDDGVDRAGPSIAVRPIPIAPPGPIAPPPLPGRRLTLVPTAAPATGTSATTRTPAATATATTTRAVPPGPCLPRYGMAVSVPVDVATAAGSATMTWWHNGDPATVAYWVGVEPQLWVRPTAPGDLVTSSPVTWTTVAPPQGCRTVSYRVPGLRRGVSYTLWLEVQASLPESPAGFARTTVSRVPRIRLP